MKTIADLHALIPTLVELIRNSEHIIGDGRKLHNGIVYEEDGWFIEISYECIGEWIYDKGNRWEPSFYELEDAWGEVTEIVAYHTDEESGKETEFSIDENDELWKALNKCLECII